MVSSGQVATPRQEWYPQAKWRPCGLCVDARVCRKSSGDQVESRRQPIVRGEATRCPRGVPPLPVMAREIVRSFGGQLARKGPHDALSDYGLAVNALSSARSAAGALASQA